MEQQFTYHDGQFNSEVARVKYGIAFLAGPALHWWNNVPAHDHPQSWHGFKELLRERYRPVQAAMLARQRLGKLRQQPQHSVNQFTSAFQTTLTPIPDMSDADQVHLYMQGLRPELAAKVWVHMPTNLRDAINHAVSAEAMANFGRAALPHGNKFGNHGRHHGGYSPGASSSTSAPMDINAVESFPVEPDDQPPVPDAMGALLARIGEMQQSINALQHSSKSSKQHRGAELVSGLKPGEIAELMAAGKCFRCKQKGHMKNECPLKNKSKNA